MIKLEAARISSHMCLTLPQGHLHQENFLSEADQVHFVTPSGINWILIRHLDQAASKFVTLREARIRQGERFIGSFQTVANISK